MGRLHPGVTGCVGSGISGGCYTRNVQHVKETVRALLDRLPDDCRLDDVLYHLYVTQAVERGQADAKAGRVIPHDVVVQEARRRWQVGREK